MPDANAVHLPESQLQQGLDVRAILLLIIISRLNEDSPSSICPSRNLTL
jgi:hypothetical protein